MNAKILVAGGTGFIGSRLVKALQKNYPDSEIFVVSKSEFKKESNVKFIQADLSKESEFSKLPKEIDFIFNLMAAIPSNSKDIDAKNLFQVNSLAVHNLLKYAKQSKAKKFIHSSSMSVYGSSLTISTPESTELKPQNNYGLSKVLAEKYCEQFSDDFKIFIMRYSSVYGLGQQQTVLPLFINKALNNQHLEIYGEGARSTDFIYVEDVVNANLLALQNESQSNLQIFNIGSGVETSMLELAESVNQIFTGVKNNIVKKQIKEVSERNEEQRFSMGISKAKSILGFTPSSLINGLKKYKNDIENRIGENKDEEKNKKEQINILITGAGGQLGQSIIKSIRFSEIKAKIIGVDCDPLSAGLYRIEKSYIVPRVNEPDYLSKLKQIINQEEIGIIFVGSDKELLFLSKNKDEIEKETGAKIVISNQESMSIATDKLLTAKFQQENGFLYPDYAQGNQEKEIKRLINQKSFPLILKPRSGSGSSSVHVVKNNEELNHLLEKSSDQQKMIVQEKLQPDEEEYTIGVYISPRFGVLGSMSLHRQLMGGLTGKALIKDFPELRKVAEELASKVGLHGPCNIQLRKTNNGPVVFEINPRLSSTNFIQAYHGFNAVELAIKDYLFQESEQQLKEKINRKDGVVMRFYEELFVDEKTHQNLKQNNSLDNPDSEIKRLL